MEIRKSFQTHLSQGFKIFELLIIIISVGWESYDKPPGWKLYKQIKIKII